MPGLVARRPRRKWTSRLLRAFCIRSSSSTERVHLAVEKELLKELEEQRYICRRSPSSLDEWEEVLWLAGLAVVAPQGASMPVLDICMGFENYELRNLETKTYTSYKDSYWDKVISQQGFAKMACSEFPDDPVIDGLPASIWLECVEPTLAILMSLSILKHRKCNLTVKKSILDRPIDSSNSQHGDFQIGPLPIFTLPRRGVLRLGMGLRQGFRAEAPNIIQMTFNNRPPSRNNSRRHRLRQLYHFHVVQFLHDGDHEDSPMMNNGARFEDAQQHLVDGNVNQNANAADLGQRRRGLDVLPGVEVVEAENIALPNSGPADDIIRELVNNMAENEVQEILEDVVAQLAIHADVERTQPLARRAQGEQEQLQGRGASAAAEVEQGRQPDQPQERDKPSEDNTPAAEPQKHEPQITLTSSQLILENNQCNDIPKYRWNAGYRMLERNETSVPIPSTKQLVTSLRGFTSSECGDWRNSAHGSEMMRKASKDHHTRRALMLAINKICVPVSNDENHKPSKLKKVRVRRDTPRPTEVPPDILEPQTRRERVLARMRQAWSAFRKRMSRFRDRITRTRRP